MPARNGKSKAARIAEEIAQTVNAAQPVALETVDFSDTERPKTCLEVDFPILGLRGFVWMRRPEVAGSGAARLRWSHA